MEHVEGCKTLQGVLEKLHLDVDISARHANECATLLTDYIQAACGRVTQMRPSANR